MSDEQEPDSILEEVSGLFLDTTRIFPLPQSMWNSHCDHCDKRQSRWMFLPTDMPGAPAVVEERGPGRIRARGHVICSLCWLYESEWGRRRREAIDGMVRKFEIETKSILARMADGRLWSCQDADRVLSMIALMSRIFIQKRMRDCVAAAKGEKDGGSGVK